MKTSFEFIKEDSPAAVMLANYISHFYGARAHKEQLFIIQLCAMLFEVKGSTAACNTFA